jgi:hypothetical protein
VYDAGDLDREPLAPTTVLARADGWLERRTDTFVVVLGAGAPVVLRGTAIAIWDAFARPRRIDVAAARLAAEFAADPALVEEQMLPVLEHLRAERAMTIRGQADDGS